MLELAADQPAPDGDAPKVLRRRAAVADGSPIPYGTYLPLVFPNDDPPQPYLPPAVALAEVTEAVKAELGPDYWALHLRRGDMLFRDGGYRLFSSDPALAARRLRQAGIADGTRAFLMSDDRSRRFAAPLQRACDLVWERECRPLQELERETRDNYQVYMAAFGVLAGARRVYLTTTVAEALHTFRRKRPPFRLIPGTAPLPAKSEWGNATFVSYLGNQDPAAPAPPGGVPLRYKARWLLLRARWRLQRMLPG